MEQHLQYALLPSIRLNPAGSQQGETVGRRETLLRISHFPAGKRSDETCPRRRCQLLAGGLTQLVRRWVDPLTHLYDGQLAAREWN